MLTRCCTALLLLASLAACGGEAGTDASQSSPSPDATSKPSPKAPSETSAPEDPAADGVDEALLATTERADGTSQVTYAGHPLYFYAHEEPHEVKCHDVFLNGGTWYVVRPDGEAAPPG